MSSYKVVPFTADVQAGQGVGRAATQLQQLIAAQAVEDWEYMGLENLRTVVRTPGIPGNNGCFGIGAVPDIPERTDHTDVHVAVFRRTGARPITPPQP
jgi:hypothetical protein